MAQNECRIPFACDTKAFENGRSFHSLIRDRIRLRRRRPRREGAANLTGRKIFGCFSSEIHFYVKFEFKIFPPKLKNQKRKTELPGLRIWISSCFLFVATGQCPRRFEISRQLGSQSWARSWERHSSLRISDWPWNGLVAPKPTNISISFEANLSFKFKHSHLLKNNCCLWFPTQAPCPNILNEFLEKTKN